MDRVASAEINNRIQYVCNMVIKINIVMAGEDTVSSLGFRICEKQLTVVIPGKLNDRTQKVNGRDGNVAHRQLGIAGKAIAIRENKGHWAQ